MAYDERERYQRFERDRDRDRGWRDDLPRPHRLGDRNWRGPGDDPDAGTERYGAGEAAGYGADTVSRPASFMAAPGYDAEFGGSRFDRVDVGSTGTHGAHPVSSFYGGDYRGGYGSPPGSTSSSARYYAELRRHPDPHYDAWRRRQIDALDRDYDEYRREHQSRFDREFGEWRERRTRQRQAVGQVREHMEVIGSDGRHVGTVDCTRADRIILTKSDPSAGGMHHSVPCAWIDEVGDQVKLNVTAEEASERWREEERSGALFERDEDRGGPHMLNRSFSGTYRDEE